MILFREMMTRTTWWALLVVLCLHQLVRIIGIRAQADGFIHFAGGLGITLFIWSFIPILFVYFGKLSYFWRFWLTFGGGCSAALVWELAEFAADEFLESQIQHSINETMMDLTYGFTGCSLICIVTLSLRIFKK